MSIRLLLWFGDERGYNATVGVSKLAASSCGLVMKEDITQPLLGIQGAVLCCGLVMKEDITQLHMRGKLIVLVVVW